MNPIPRITPSGGSGMPEWLSKACAASGAGSQGTVAAGASANLLHPPLTLVGVSTGNERACQLIYRFAFALSQGAKGEKFRGNSSELWACRSFDPVCEEDPAQPV